MNFFGRFTVGDARARRLGFEFLERRDLLTIIRLVDWNTANLPNDSTDIDNFQTILAAIGNETIAGNTKRLDILAVQETDPAVSPGNNSIGQIEAILDALYPSTNYVSAVSSVDGGGDSTGFIYDTATLSLVNTIEVPGSLTHKVLRGQFRPLDTLGESDIYVYSIHLKSGDTGSDATQRGIESLVLRNDADSLGEGANVLFVGDFNMKTSSETAWTNFVAGGAAQLQDVADAPGNWFNNPAFKHLHTQDPRVGGSGMDDRFDIVFASGELYDGVGVDYVADSFRVFGNNGTHTFDGNITTGSGASAEVLAALAAASDHLPVIADFELLDVSPSVRIVQSGGSTKVAEGSFYDSYSVVLNSVPTANVTVTLHPDSQLDLGNGPGVAVNLLFTPANALTPQAVIVNAVDDALLEGNHTGAITHTSVSADLDYHEISIAGVTVSIADDDAPVIVINEIDADQTGTDMAEFVELYDGGVGNVSLNGMSLVFFNGATDTAYRVISLTGFTTDANGFFLVGNAGVAGAAITFPDNTLQNGQDAVALYSGAFSNGAAVTTTNLIDAIVYDTGQADDAGLLVLLEAGEPQVNENQNGAVTTQSLARVPNGGDPRRTGSYLAQAPTPGASNQVQAGGVVITHSGTRIDVEEGGATDSYQIALATIPAANVTITVDPDSQTDLGAGAGVAIVLVFTPMNALVPQVVNVVAVDDAVVEGVHTGIITHSAVSSDAAYNGLAIGNVVANIVDNDAAPPTSIVISEIMYNPASDESNPGVSEWIEIVNVGAGTVDLGNWLFDDEDATNWGAIPAGTMLAPGQVAVFYDSAFTTEATFRAEWSVPVSALVIGISWGSLANDPSVASPENLELRDSLGALIDNLSFDNTAPWPAISGAGGPSIYLTNLSADNSAGSAWAKSVVAVDGAVSPSGPTFSTSDVGSPGSVPVVGELPGDYNGNGTVDAADYTVWQDTVGSTTDFRADGSGPSVGVPDGVVNALDYEFWKANFGNALGSGSASVVSSGGRGGMQLMVAADEPVAEPQSALPLEAVVEDSPVARPLAFDPAWLDAETDSTSHDSSATLAGSLSAADQYDLLLVLTRKSTSAIAENSVSVGSTADDFADVDEFFASLEERELAIGLL